MEGEVIIMKWSKRRGIIEKGSQELLYRGGVVRFGAFCIVFSHNKYIRWGRGYLAWKYQERGASMPREEGKKDIIVITLT
jgi:hypothetical protein